MHLLDTLTRAADEEQLRLRPLPDHAAATQPEHLRRHYALLLAAVLTAQPTISEPQTRLLRLLLDALKLGDLRGTLFEQARDLTPEPLLEAARLIREAGFAHHLVLDALVLLRLDAPLGDEAARLAGELAAFCGLDENQLATRAADAFEILGLDKSEDSTDAKDPSAPRPLLLAEIWPSRLRQPLTRKALRSGLQGGLWLLDANLDVDFPWQADDALLFFKNGATLNTFAKEGEIKLTDCRLVDAVLDFQGACSIALERCDWQGDYDPEAKRTALRSNGQKLTVVDCIFSTRNAQAIFIDADLLLKKSIFSQCGNLEMESGAVQHIGQTNKSIEDCKFLECKGKNAGAINISHLTGISNCEFSSCIGETSYAAYKKEKPRDIAICTTHSNLISPLVGCVFRKTSMFVWVEKSQTVVAEKTQFIDGSIFYNLSYHSSSASAASAGCSFFNGKTERIQ